MNHVLASMDIYYIEVNSLWNENKWVLNNLLLALHESLKILYHRELPGLEVFRRTYSKCSSNSEADVSRRESRKNDSSDIFTAITLLREFNESCTMKIYNLYNYDIFPFYYWITESMLRSKFYRLSWTNRTNNDKGTFYFQLNKSWLSTFEEFHGEGS